MFIINQGVAIQPCFQQAKHMQFCKTGQYIVFIKTRTKHASKGGIELAVFKAFQDVLSFGLGVTELVLIHLLAVLLVDGFSLGHSVIYGDDGATANKHKQAHINTQKSRVYC